MTDVGKAQPSWALVTGASSGIGEAISRDLARRGMAIVVCGRDAERVEGVRAACGGGAIGVVSDLALVGGAELIFDRLRREGIEPMIVVNNAGSTVHGPFVETDLEAELSLVRLQIDATMAITKHCLPAMIARGNGRVLNVGSLYGYSAAPFQAVYAACKTFMLGFSRSLRAELTGTGVTVTLVSPGLTRSRFRSRDGIVERESGLMMEADHVARIACDALMARRPSVVPGFKNKLFVLGTRLLPERWMVGIVSRVNERRNVGAGS